ncbi:MAG TPA: lasso peptide biosynthesis B2 protein [Vitreimonas sp.]|uniref:lasso peptide biosynthesis B2 protein n=1 Tax=Vitreimonas sp. TaxID=3069702 RepID=UPI002D68DE50|nr:lasso peptide biosynthesis B2 protein [Vitreimonas sp.]HYD86044.1 lasso peptide biosynthesis B2 protein [Vitreimonas sp.]
MTERLYLAEDVYVCVTEGHGVFLDLKQDKYSAVMFVGAPAASGGDDAADYDSASALAEKLAQQSKALLAAGLLTTDKAKGKSIEATPIERPHGHIFGLDDQRAFGLTGPAAAELEITLRDLWDFFAASWKASRELKTKHISQVVERARRRKRAARDPDTDIEQLRRRTAIYRRLRPWYPRKYLCLYDSLALVEFLARRKVYPVWVFAVQAQPFGAHCWVQHEGLLLNEGTEYAGQFTPIMSI